MDISRHALCCAVALTLGLTASSAWACSLKDQRQQVSVLAQFSAAPMRLPQEVSLRTGDLLSVLVLRRARLRVVDANDQPSDAVAALDAARYQHLSRHNGAKAPAEISAGTYPAHLEWRHFGAGLPGAAYLMLTVDKEQALLRVQVDPRPPAPRGQDWVWSDARQSDPVALTPFDTLTLNLPGTPGDGWQVAMAGRPVAVASISAQAQATDAPARVLLQLNAADLWAGERADTFTVRHAGGAVYRFTVRPLAVAAC
ncbi:hypothetical protein [Thauera linaloolentis]|uniref:hypothetical protein n=1 Tax=Thauera linaloolentis TaxID=76112 RepID=UPI0012B541E4|nr:hypothetical protein [Thauera linaloolentis]MCM8565407.1 hypothetical protein [Thauera linaloolentis]